MKEDFLHYVWQFKKFRFDDAETASGLPVVITDVGFLNSYAGPDFFNSRLRIGEQLWAGNVEIHINSSDWYVHGHETDPNYDNVILHVVWNHDVDIYRKDNSVIPVLELKGRVNQAAFRKYEELLESPSKKWINCEKDFPGLDDFRVQNWLERLYFERLEAKYEIVRQLLTASSNNWEEVFFKMLCKNFGLNLNGDSFLGMAGSFPFSLILKLQDQTKLEALFFGQAGMLEEEIEEPYYNRLKQEYLFLKAKHGLSNTGVVPVKYFRLRPDNFPTIRLAQLAALYARHSSLFTKVVQAESIEEIYNLLDLEVSAFWDGHFTFRKDHSPKKKRISKSFLDLLIINTLIPIKFSYARYHGQDIDEKILAIMSSVQKEKNQIVKKFDSLRPRYFKGALHSQALLQLKKNYCDKNLCLKCHLGTNLLQREDQFNIFGICKD